jgi:hypothetical protein
MIGKKSKIIKIASAGTTNRNIASLLPMYFFMVVLPYHKIRRP